MSLFDKFNTNKKLELTEAEAAFCIFLSVIYADGTMSDDEKSELGFYFSKIKLFKNLKISDLFNEFQKLFKEYEFNGEKVVEACCPFISSENRFPVFIYCCDFVYSDTTQKINEERILEKVMYGLTLDENLAEGAMKIMKRKSQL
ncbi:MAG: TerB family tellurite resistance protein [Bacteroidales bacterium]